MKYLYTRTYNYLIPDSVVEQPIVQFTGTILKATRGTCKNKVPRNKKSSGFFRALILMSFNQFYLEFHIRIKIVNKNSKKQMSLTYVLLSNLHYGCVLLMIVH
jgi:hypothetical protein